MKRIHPAFLVTFCAFLNVSLLLAQSAQTKNIPLDVKTLSSSILDETFGTNGTVLTFFKRTDSVNTTGQSVAVQKDGKIVVAGYSSQDFIRNFVIARYRNNGILDSAFGTNGAVTTQFSGGFGRDLGYAAAIQSDGKIVAVGTSSNNGPGSAFAVARYDTNGVLDNTFGGNGMVRTQINGVSGSNDQGYSVAIQPDGKIVVAGTSDSAFAVARFNTDGTLDNSFGTNGTAKTAIKGGDSTDDQCRSVALQSDGKIVLAGVSYASASGGYAFATARFDSNGVLDSAFGEEGTQRASFAGYASSVSIQTNGKIVIAGHSSSSTGIGNMFTAYRLKANGVIDSTFGTNGKVTNNISGGNASDDKEFSVVIQADGKIILAGTSKNSAGYAFAAARYDTSGIIDNTFGTNGTVRMAINGGDGKNDEAASVSIQPDGKLVMAGYSFKSSFSAFALARYDTNGTIDGTFGANGTVRTEIIGAYDNDQASSAAVQPDGKIVVIGTSRAAANSNMSFAVARYNTDGTLDSTFGADGMVKSSITGGTGRDNATSVAIQPDGKIVAVGTSYANANPITAFAVTRYNTDGTLDPAFGTNGSVRSAITGSNGFADEGNGVAIQSDGKIVVAGSSHNGVRNAFALARFNTDGTLDNTFGINGTVRTPGVIYGVGRSVALQPDGKIVVGGYFINGSVGTFGVVRYNTNGTLDNTFGTAGIVQSAINGGNGTTDGANAVAVQSDGKIVAAGGSYNTENYAFAAARYNTNGTLDATFGTNGTVRTTVIGSDGNSDRVKAIAIQPDGKIIIGGDSKNGSSYAFGLARYTANGRLDSTFTATGTARVQVNGSNGIDDGNGITLQSNGKIVMVGQSNFVVTNAFAVARFLPGSMPYGSALAATGMSDSTATMKAVVFPLKVSTSVRFVYGTAPGVYTDSVNASPATVDGDTITVVSAALSSLPSGTKYYFCVSGTSTLPANYFRSDEKSFITHSIPPPPLTISPNGATSVNRKSAFLWHSSFYATGYHLQVATDSLFSFVVFDTTLTDTSTIVSNPLTATTQHYWKVSAMNASGSSEYSSIASFTTGTILVVAEKANGIPKEYALYQNYPNPFNPTTTVKYQLPANSFVTLKIYDALGKEVASLVNERQDAGYYTITVNGATLSSGVYFYRFQGGTYNSTKKFLLLK